MVQIKASGALLVLRAHKLIWNYYSALTYRNRSQMQGKLCGTKDSQVCDFHGSLTFYLLLNYIQNQRKYLDQSELSGLRPDCHNMSQNEDEITAFDGYVIE